VSAGADAVVHTIYEDPECKYVNSTEYQQPGGGKPCTRNPKKTVTTVKRVTTVCQDSRASQSRESRQPTGRCVSEVPLYGVGPYEDPECKYVNSTEYQQPGGGIPENLNPKPETLNPKP